jgi:Fe-S-cluster containining protein
VSDPSELDCQRCGACCREAYGAVTVEEDDLVLVKHASLVRTESDGFRTMRRVPERSLRGDPDDTRCIALTGDGSSARLFTCEIYADRPSTCHEFTLGSEHCETARRRVGLLG